MNPKTRARRLETYRGVYRDFEAPVSAFDCGQKCAHLNGGEPVCCSTGNAIPLADRAEFDLLQSRTDLWRRFKPDDAASRRIVAEVHQDCVAIECKGARHCERDNRTLACRAFPFGPYITRAGEFLGLTYYRDFEETCWVISNLRVVTPRFARECIAAFEAVFAVDRLEFEAHLEESAQVRRVFTRRGRVFPVIDRAGALLAVEPRTHLVRAAVPEEFPAFGPYRAEEAPRPPASMADSASAKER